MKNVQYLSLEYMYWKKWIDQQENIWSFKYKYNTHTHIYIYIYIYREKMQEIKNID